MRFGALGRLLDLKLKSDMNTKAKKTLETIAYQGRSILSSPTRASQCHWCHIGIQSCRRAAKLTWDFMTRTYMESSCRRIALSVELSMRDPNSRRWQMLLHFGRAFISARRDAVKARRQTCLVRIEFQSVAFESSR